LGCAYQGVSKTHIKAQLYVVNHNQTLKETFAYREYLLVRYIITSVARNFLLTVHHILSFFVVLGFTLA
jgi:hypothetical protein